MGNNPIFLARWNWGRQFILLTPFCWLYGFSHDCYCKNIKFCEDVDWNCLFNQMILSQINSTHNNLKSFPRKHFHLNVLCVKIWWNLRRNSFMQDDEWFNWCRKTFLFLRSWIWCKWILSMDTVKSTQTTFYVITSDNGRLSQVL